MQKQSKSKELSMEQLQRRVAKLEAQLNEVIQVRQPQSESVRYLDLQSACEMLGVSRSTFYLEMRAGRIPYTYVGRQRKFLERDLKEYLLKNYVSGTDSILPNHQ
jgi:excisionase family DNA binding protein